MSQLISIFPRDFGENTHSFSNPIQSRSSFASPWNFGVLGGLSRNCHYSDLLTFANNYDIPLAAWRSRGSSPLQPYISFWRADPPARHFCLCGRRSSNSFWQIVTIFCNSQEDDSRHLTVWNTPGKASQFDQNCSPPHK